MKKGSINVVSTRLIRRILQRDIAKKSKKMSDAINGNIAVFKGVQPFTAIAVTALILAFTTAEGAYAVGGILKKNDFLNAKAALYDCVLEFAPYVNALALGDKVILDLSTLPLLSDELDIAKLIADGAIADNVTAKQGASPRQIITNCNSFGEKVNYIVIISEGIPLPAGFYVESNGTVTLPDGNRCFVNSLGNRRKSFVNLLPKTEYFVYYVLTYGASTVGVVSAGVSIVTSA